jgi:hypothetical protein
MKLLKSLLLLLVVSSSLFAGAKHCIQVTTVLKYKEGEIRRPILNIIENYDKARIDKRGNSYVLRVGEYKNASSAKKDLRKIRRNFRDAFVRRCDYDPISAIYPPFEDNMIEESTEEVVPDVEEEIIENQIEETTQDAPVVAKVATAPATQEFNYKKQEKYNYEFWRECKKCFAPMDKEVNNDYSDEELNDDVVNDEIVEDVVPQTRSAKANLYSSNTTQEDQEMIEHIQHKTVNESVDSDDEEPSTLFGWLFGSNSSDDDVNEDNIEVDVEGVDLDDGQNSELYNEAQNSVNDVIDDIDEVEESTSYYAE